MQYLAHTSMFLYRVSISINRKPEHKRIEANIAIPLGKTDFESVLIACVFLLIVEVMNMIPLFRSERRNAKCPWKSLALAKTVKRNLLT